jgi:magnesium chelatase family protein
MVGIDAREVVVEAHLSNGLPGFAIVGMPETAVRESKERVRSAIINSGLEFPARRITVNLAPADLPKAGGQYDLAIALGILGASDQVELESLQHTEILGELALDGEIRQVQGVIAAALAARSASRPMIAPRANAEELEGLPDKQRRTRARHQSIPSFQLVRGQPLGIRAVTIAAAGSHNLLMVGPPGCGKSMLAHNCAQLLPPLSESDAMKVACIRSLSHNSSNAMALVDPPLRSPHHSATSVALTGGGNRAMPGEVSLAHFGVLFLDEFAEFKPSVLDSLREPMEAGEITITRANYRVKYPARFQLIAAMNPCPCGYCSDPKRHCRCAPSQLQHYQKRLSGPLLDRIDLQVELPALSSAELLDASEDDYDAVSRWRQAKKQVKACRALQLQRSGKLNSNLNAEEVETLCRLSSTQRKQLAMIMDELGLSARALHRVLRVARTLADFDEQPAISEAHLLEAIAMRRLQFLNR